MADQAKGLSTAEAMAKLVEFGPNDPSPPQRSHRLAALAVLLSNPLVIILLIAAGVSYGLGDRVNSLIIVAMVIFSLALDSFQNIRSQNAVKKLQSGIAPTAVALRDGAWKSVLRRTIVPGDIVRLSGGDLVPADCRLIEERDLHVQEAALTGESLPVEKEVGTGNDEELIFLGTAVVSGNRDRARGEDGLGDTVRRNREPARR